MKCLPLETELIYSNEKLITNLGTNQGLHRGKIGLISTRNPNNSMENWSVMSVVSSDLDASILEPLNPNIDLIDLNPYFQGTISLIGSILIWHFMTI